MIPEIRIFSKHLLFPRQCFSDSVEKRFCANNTHAAIPADYCGSDEKVLIIFTPYGKTKCLKKLF